MPETNLKPPDFFKRYGESYKKQVKKIKVIRTDLIIQLKRLWRYITSLISNKTKEQVEVVVDKIVEKWVFTYGWILLIIVVIVGILIII